MSKLSKLLILIVSLSLVVMIINLTNVISKKEWIKIEAIVTSVLLPDGVVCGDFTDMNGIRHKDEQLFSDFRFEQIRAIKKVNQEKIDKYVGKKITILYNPEAGEEIKSYDRIRNYNEIIINNLFSILIFIISFTCFIIIQKGKKSN